MMVAGNVDVTRSPKLNPECLSCCYARAKTLIPVATLIFIAIIAGVGPRALEFLHLRLTSTGQ
jgi:hypothetical protein